MTIDQHSVLAVLDPHGIELKVNRLRVTLDEAWMPYAQVEAICSIPPVDRDLLDPRQHDLRLRLVIRRDFGASWTLADLTADVGGATAALTALMGGQPLSSLTNRYYEPWNGPQVRAGQRRALNLNVTERVFDDAAKELLVVAASDDSLLVTDALVATEPLDPGSDSLLDICQAVLDRHGRALGGDSVDATVSELEATIWQPGTTAAGYLNPMLEAASLRLWSDESGVFHLTPREATTPGAVIISPAPGSMTGHRDRITFDPTVWFDAVVIEYRWVDEFDLNRVEYDVAGEPTPRSCLFLTRASAYPGPGAAAGILYRGQGRGRTLEVTAVSDYTLSPGQPATINPPDPDSDAQTGYLSAVTWSWPEAEMQVSTRGLVDTPETAWLFAPVGLTWNDVPVGMSWLEYTPEGVA